MGQSNTKGTPNSKPNRSNHGSSRAPGMRPSTVSSAIVHSPAPHPSQASHYIDPMSDSTPESAHHSGLLSAPTPNSAFPDPPQVANTFPIVLRYCDQDARNLMAVGKAVHVMVEAMNWQPVPMTPSTDSFYALLQLPQGSHNYRFLIDDNEVVDCTQPMAPSTSCDANPLDVKWGDQRVPYPVAHLVPARDGKPANTIILNDVLLTTKEDDDMIDDGQGWGQETVLFEESRKYPPIVPLHLRYTPLNTPPTLVRCSRDGRMAVMNGGDIDEGARMPPEHLPLPLSVTINHVYFQRRENHAVMGVTTRYCNKYTTVVYYTSMTSKPADLVSLDA